jgi:hypothetical protein
MRFVFHWAAAEKLTNNRARRRSDLMRRGLIGKIWVTGDWSDVKTRRTVKYFYRDLSKNVFFASI